LVPTGNPLVDGVGPAAWAERPDLPDINPHGDPVIRPMSKATSFNIAAQDTNPIGLNVITADGQVAGQVSDVWIDTMESVIRYYEVTNGNKSFMLPMHFAVLRNELRGKIKNKEFYVHALMADQYKDIPSIAKKDQITMLEEEKIQAYFGGGNLYATPQRAEPLL
jgi:photosynthetic reaction center H subunit